MEVKGGVKEEVKGGVKEEVKGEVKEGVKEEVKGEVKEGVKEEVKKEVKGEVKGLWGVGDPGGETAGHTTSTKDGFRDKGGSESDIR